MNKITDQQTQEIVALLDNKKWVEAEESLLNLCKTSDPWVYFCLGYVYDAWTNPKRDEKTAKDYFSLATESDQPVEYAFTRLSRIESNKSHSIRILRKGLQFFPKSEAIYYQLLSYTLQAEREGIFKEIIGKECLSERIITKMLLTYYDLKAYEKVINALSGVDISEEWDRNILACIKGFSLYELGKHTEAGNVFQKLIEEDINHKLKYIPHVGLTIILLDTGILTKAEQLIEEIPLDIDIYESAYPILEPGPWGESYLDASEYFNRAINTIIKKTQNKKIKGIARGLRGLFFYSKAFEEETKKNKLQDDVKKDLEFAIKVFPENKEIVKYLWRVFKESDPLKAWYYLVQNVLNDCEDIYGSDDFIDNIDAKLFNDFYKDFLNRVTDSYIAKKLSKCLLSPIIERLFKDKRYKDVLVTTNHFTDSDLFESDVLFKTAYSYAEEKDLVSSKKYYELCLSKNGESNPVLNNLGIIFEQTGNLFKAKELFLKAAERNSKDDTCRRNLRRVEDEIKKKGKIEYELQEVVEGYRNESPYVHKKMLDFYSHRNDDGLIICSYRQAPQFLKMLGPQAVNFLNDLLSKKFFIKVTEHGYDTQSNVYRLNPYIEPELANIEESLKGEAELLLMCERLNTKSLTFIGYDDKLLNNLAKMSSDELRAMLHRDLKENALAVILKQNKSALVLSGSIIEAILTDRIMANKITKYNINKNIKTVLMMDLNDLLEVAEKEKIIDSTMSHLAHGVRGYRNLIHPGVEQRKGTLQVNDSNVELAWGIVKKLLNEIK